MTKKLLFFCVIVFVIIALFSCVPVKEGMTLQEAIQIVLDDVLPQEIPAGSDYICAKYDTTLPAGTVLEENSPGAPGYTPVNVTVQEDSLLFVLDLAPGGFYAHPLKYILVSKATGETQTFGAEWEPKINGEVPQIFKQKILPESAVIASNVTLLPSTGQIIQYVFPLIALQWKEAFIVVQGLESNESLFGEAQNSYLDFIAFALAYKNARPTGQVIVDGLVQSDAKNVLTKINTYASQVQLITIYIIAHGNVDIVKLGGQIFTANQFRSTMAAHPEVRFNFMLGSCHGGSFINNLSSLSNVKAVMTACRSDESAYPDWDIFGSLHDYNKPDIGSEWTSSILQVANSIITNTSKWNTIVSLARSYKIPETCVLLRQSSYGAFGANPGMGFNTNYDLSNRAGYSTPQGYYSWGP